MYIVTATDPSGRKYLCGCYDVQADANARVAAEQAKTRWQVSESHLTTAFAPAIEIPLGDLVPNSI